jgi:hypothetical protein
MRSAIPRAVSGVASDVVPTQQFRVKRPNMISDAARSKRQENALPPGNESDPLTHVSEIRAQSSSSSKMHLQSNPDAAVVPTPGSCEDGVVALYPQNPSSSDSFPRVTELPRATASKMQLQRLPDPAAALALAESIPARKMTTPNSPVGNQTSLATMGSLSRAMEVPRAHIFSHVEMHLQRRHDRAESSAAGATVLAGQAGREVSGSSSQEDGKALSGEKNNPPATVSREIRVAPFPAGGTAIVWRKAVANGAGAGTVNSSPGAQFTGPTHAGSSQLMRQAATNSGSSATSAPPNATTIVTPSSSRGETDIVYVAERVSRVIARQLIIERERRGKI